MVVMAWHGRGMARHHMTGVWYGMEMICYGMTW